jgi:hypothetical protein
MNGIPFALYIGKSLLRNTFNEKIVFVYSMRSMFLGICNTDKYHLYRFGRERR